MIDAITLVTESNAGLVRLGVPRESATYERMRGTGHMRRLSPTWARSLGLWGGVRTMREISVLLDAPVARVHSWARYRRLRTRTRRFTRTQAQIAVAALAAPGPARDVARTLGVLPVEAALYRGAAERLRQEMGVGLREVLTWTPVELDEVWNELGLRVEHVPRTTVNFDDPAELDAIVREAQGGWSRDQIGEIVALAMRELPEVDDEETSAW